MLLAALRRLTLLVLLTVGFTAAGSLLVGALVGGSLNRAVTLGFYLMGCFLLVAGFFVGNRGPARVKGESAGAGSLLFPVGGRQVRWATAREQNETILNSGIFITLGVILVVVGTLVDTRHALF